ncbi:MAG: ribosome recycling factor [Chitinophagaceae bacterium]
MSEELAKIKSQSVEAMNKAIQHLEAELVKVRAGKATPGMLDGLVTDYYGNPTPISQVANISVADARTLTIQPWEKNMLPLIEKSIIAANIGITPQNDGNMIRLFLPPLTEERRKELVKKSQGEGEHSKVAIRNIRRDAMEHVKKLQKNGLSEDLCKDAEKEIQEVTDKYITRVDQHLSAKEKEIMTV